MCKKNYIIHCYFFTVKNNYLSLLLGQAGQICVAILPGNDPQMVK